MSPSGEEGTSVPTPICTTESIHTDVHIGKNCFIGYGAIVLPGVRIGDSVIVTGNSVVGRDVPANSVVMGNPARVVENNIVTGPWGIRLDKGNVTPIRH